MADRHLIDVHVLLVHDDHVLLTRRRDTNPAFDDLWHLPSGKLDAGDFAAAQDLSYKAILEAARALTYERFPNVGTDPQEIHDEFKKHLVDTQLFRDHYAGDKFYDYFKNAHNRRNDKLDGELVSHQVQEATLFIEASHACVERMDKAKAAAQPAAAAPAAAPAE